MKKPITILSIIAFVFVACKDIYAPNIINDDPRYLVVDGIIVVGANSTTTFRLSRTIGLPDTAKAQLEKNAKVTIEVENGSSYTLIEETPGNYIVRNLNITIGKKCRLKIITANQGSYTSAYVPVKASPEIDSIGAIRQRGDFQIYVNSHDDNSLTQYYRWTTEGVFEYNSQFYSYKKFNAEDSTLIAVEAKEREKLFRCWQTDNSTQIFIQSTDHLSVDEVFQAQLKRFNFGDERLAVGYSINVHQYALTKEAYKYFSNLRRITEQLGGLFDPLPSELKGNIRNDKDPVTPVIGFVTATTVSSKRRFFSRPSDWKYEFRCAFADTVKDYSKAGLYAYFGPYRGYPVYIDNSTLKPLAAILNYRCIDCSLRGGSNIKPEFWPF